MEVRIFTAPRIRRELEDDRLSVLISEFRKYIKTGDPGQYFGRDYPYDRPDSVRRADLWHMHVHPNFNSGQNVNTATNHLKTWRLNGFQRDKRSDTCLIYCQGQLSSNNYLLLAFLKENAHTFASRVTALGVLVEEAEKFRKSY